MDESRGSRRLGSSALLALIVAACSTGTSGPSIAPPASSSPVSPTPVIAETTGPLPSPSGPAPLRLVVLGDSIATGGEESGGISFGTSLAAGIERVSGRNVELMLLAEPPTTSESLLGRVRNGTTLRAAIAGADIVTITVGGNDVDPFATYPAGTCREGGDPAACLTAYSPDLEANLDAIVAEIVLLRAGQPTAIRVTSPDYNPFIGLEQSPDLPPFAADFGLTFYRQAAEAELLAACRVAERHGAICVDFYHAFNGPDGTQDAASLLAEDHLHPSELGQQLIADLLLSAGFAPVFAAAN